MDEQKMNEHDHRYFERLIKVRLASLEAESASGHDAQAIVELDQQAVGRLSRMDALQNQAMAKATGARRNAERGRLEAALRRIEEGEYGYCEDCGEDIALGRLRLDPAALKCVECATG